MGKKEYNLVTKKNRENKGGRREKGKIFHGVRGGRLWKWKADPYERGHSRGGRKESLEERRGENLMEHPKEKTGLTVKLRTGDFQKYQKG